MGGRGLHYFVKQKDAFRDKSCVIVGGGDSALDWTLGLQDTARLPILLVHRRDRFRALESSVSQAKQLEEEGKVRIIVPSEVREIRGNGAVERLVVENTKTGEVDEVDCEALITLLGFHSHLGSIADWGLELHGNARSWSTPRHGDDDRRRLRGRRRRGLRGKITLISVGFGEARSRPTRRLRRSAARRFSRSTRRADRRPQGGRANRAALCAICMEECRRGRQFERVLITRSGDAVAGPRSHYLPAAMTYLTVECLRGAAALVESPTEIGGRGDAGECPRCHYLGWAPSEALDESIRRRIREQSPEIRAHIKLVAGSPFFLTVCC